MMGSFQPEEVVMNSRFLSCMLAGLIALGGLSAPVSAQVRTVDPNDAAAAAPAPTVSDPQPGAEFPADAGTGPMDTAEDTTMPVDPAVGSTAASESAVPAADGAVPTGKTYKRDDLIGAAEGVFGKGAQGLGELIEKILKDQGEPNAYIAGREASGAVVVGLRYGSGTMRHGVEGDLPVYWTGPSVGFDLGADAAKVFVLVYNLYDSEDLFRRYPQVEGRAYFVGGFSATYLRRGNIAIIPVRLGAGLRLGANIGYMKFTHKSKWLPF
jgi:hypothetical protein